MASSSLPQMNIVGVPPLNVGFTMRAWPTELKAFTKRTRSNSRWRRSINDSSRVVKNRKTREPVKSAYLDEGTTALRFLLPARCSPRSQLRHPLRNAIFSFGVRPNSRSAGT